MSTATNEPLYLFSDRLERTENRIWVRPTPEVVGLFPESTNGTGNLVVPILSVLPSSPDVFQDGTHMRLWRVVRAACGLGCECAARLIPLVDGPEQVGSVCDGPGNPGCHVMSSDGHCVYCGGYDPEWDADAN